MEKNLGHATAYGYAKSKGYSGTEDEFAELMADYASVGQSAAQSAEQAAESATSASGSAATASQAAQTATSKAEDAVTAAGTATTKASEASTSAGTASTAAQTATDKASEATTAAATATTKASEASESATTASTAKTDAETARDAAAQSASEAAASAESIDPDEFNRKIYAAFATDTATGAIAHFADGADSIPMKDVLVHIEPVQAGSGDPSPENVRPITGWTGAKVTRTGKNLCDSLFSDGKAPSVSGGALVNADNACRSDYIPISGGSVTFSCKNISSRTIYCFLYGENKDFLLYTTSTLNFVTATHADAKYAMIRCDGGVTAPDESMLELGSTATDYEPCSGQTYDITFPTEAGTVYGGTLDVTKGELVVDRFLYVYDGTETDFRKSPGALNGFYNSIANNPIHGWPKMLNYSRSQITSEISSIFKMTRTVEEYKQNYGYCFLDSGMNFNCYPSVFGTTVNSFTAKLAELYENGTPVSVFAKLATPITYQLTPQEITSLLGTNNVWADTGDSDVEYRADTKLYITKKITEAVSALS